MMSNRIRRLCPRSPWEATATERRYTQNVIAKTSAPNRRVLGKFVRWLENARQASLGTITVRTAATSTYTPKLSPYTRGENKPNFVVGAVVGIAYPWPHFGGARSVTTRGWAGQRSRPRRGRTCPKARPAAAGARRCSAGARWEFRGGPESYVWRLASRSRPGSSCAHGTSGM